jgi:hypothetical protein
VALSYFSTLSHKRCDFLGGKKIAEYKKFVLIFSTKFSEKILNLRRIQLDIVMNFHRLQTARMTHRRSFIENDRMYVPSVYSTGKDSRSVE